LKELQIFVMNQIEMVCVSFIFKAWCYKMVLNTYKYTQLQSSFSVNNIALVKGRPQMLNLKDMIHYFVEHRHDVVIRRTIWIA
jgi:DNA gyrase/topoisomerase IV subunit A